ncbi:MAG: hypothetical protein AB4911_09050 [Oscillochloridaceae bacterium umkhey_bin13]
MVWGTTIWLSARLLFRVDDSYAPVLRMVTLGAAPFVFGFLVLIPYAGTFIGRVLGVWSLLIVLAAVNFISRVVGSGAMASRQSEVLVSAC